VVWERASSPFDTTSFGTLNEEQFFSSIRRVCKSNDHYLHVMSMFRLTLAITAIRTRLGLGPDLEEGTKRQKHGDVLFEPLPRAIRGYEGIPMCRVRSLALTAMVRSDVYFPAAYLEAWTRLDALVLPLSEPCFIEHLVPVSKSADRHMPLFATRALSRSMVLDSAGWWVLVLTRSRTRLTVCLVCLVLLPLTLSECRRQPRQERHYSPLMSRPRVLGPALWVRCLFRCSPWRSVVSCRRPDGRSLQGLGCPVGGTASMRS
jgi:hypothetical protein